MVGHSKLCVAPERDPTKKGSVKVVMPTAPNREYGRDTEEGRLRKIGRRRGMYLIFVELADSSGELVALHNNTQGTCLVLSFGVLSLSLIPSW